MGLTVPPGASGVDLIKIGSIFQAPQWQQDLFVRGTGRQQDLFFRHREATTSPSQPVTKPR